MEMTVRSEMVKIGHWSDQEGLVTSEDKGIIRYRPSNRKSA